MAVPLPSNTPLILISAPSYLDSEASADADSAFVEVSTINDPVPIRVNRGILKLEAEILLAAYLDDIKLPAELHLLRPFTQALSDLGPDYGLFFIKRAKNYLYVPRTFLSAAQLLFPDAAFATDESPGSSTDDKLKGAAAGLVPHRNQLLISTIGIPRLMGLPTVTSLLSHHWTTRATTCGTRRSSLSYSRSKRSASHIWALRKSTSVRVTSWVTLTPSTSLASRIRNHRYSS